MAPENGHDDGEGNENTVFIDTSLETHLATIVSDCDTVSDLKRKIVLEHRQCFPAIGDIKIHCLKVKRRGNYYHLADSMLVKSAFGASQKNWFLSVDASHLEQCDGVGIHHKPGDQLALPWVNDSLSIDKHDNHVDRPSKLSLIHGSPSNHPKIVPFVSQKAPSVDQFTSDDSCKKVSKNIEEDRSSNLEPDLEQQLGSKVEKKLCSVNKEMKYKKRIRDVQNEDTSVKKRRKTRRTKGDVKGSEEDRVLTDDIDMVKDMGTSINDENSIEDKSKSKDAAFDGVVTKALNDEHTRTILVSQKKPKRTKKVKKSAHDQVATVVPSSVEDVGEEIRSQTNTKASENMPDCAMVLEKNIQQEATFQSSQKEIGNELVEDADIGNKIPSSSMKGVTAEDEMLVKQADDLVVDKSSTVPIPVFDEKIFDEQKNDETKIVSDEKSEVLEKGDDNKGDDLVVKEVKIAEPTESHRSRRHKEKSRKEVKETAGKRIKKKDVGKSLKKDEVMKHSNDAATGTNEDNLLPPSERKESLEITSIDALHVVKDAEFSKTEMKTSQQNAEVSEKQNENMNDTKVKKEKKKKKKSAARDEGETLTKHVDVDLHEKIADVSQADVVTDGEKLKSKDAQISDEGLVKKPKKNHKSLTRILELESVKSIISEETSLDVIVSQVPKGNDVNSLTSKLELESVKSKIPEETSLDVIVSQVPKGNDVISNVDSPKEGSHDIDFMEYFSPTQQSNNITALDNVENGKYSKTWIREKKSKKKSKEQDDNALQSLPRNENNKELLVSKKVPEVSRGRVGVKDQNIPNINKTKTTKQIDAKPAQVNKPQSSCESGSSSESFGMSFKSQKITKQQPTMGQNNHVKNLKKSAPVVKSFLNTPGTIFGNDSDDSSANDNAKTVNSDSSTHTPSRKASSSEESDSSIDSRRYAVMPVKRKEGAGKNNINSQSRLKNISMAVLLRSSSRFKKAIVTASQQVNDTESEPVDFVPESQPLSKR